MTKNLSYLLLIVLLTSCDHQQEISVQYYGSLKSIMHDAGISAKVSLSELQTIEHLYALGAAEN